LAKKSRPTKESRVFRGIPAAPGIAVGPAYRLEDPLQPVEEQHIPPSRVETEVTRFRRALELARSELHDLREATRRDLDEETARIFDIQLMVLEDPWAGDGRGVAIGVYNTNAEFLFRRHILEINDRLEGLSDSFFSDRAVDLRDVKRRVIRHLRGDGTSSAKRRGVLLGREMTPSEAVLLNPARVLGFATDSGGSTSHAAIMARARGIPAVVGARGVTEAVTEGDTVALDGFQGTVEVNPSEETLKRLRDRKRAYDRLQRQHAKLASIPAATQDGHRIQLSANMELPAELDTILERGAEGIGLFRTEFFFMWSHRAPTEEEQVRTYREIMQRVGDDGVVIRVLDLGGEKMASYMGIVRERNPFMGMRGIRYLLAHPELFKTQLRAILRAAAGRRARILFPMVSSLSELRTIRLLTKKAMSTLRRRRVPFDDSPRLGVMVEVPSAVMMADELAQEADFLSVGSNDLIQYLLAIDRDNQALVHMYQPHHPAVLRALQHTVAAAHRYDKPISLCGEMAGNPVAVPLLVGLDFDQLSVSPYLVPNIKQTLRSVSHEACRDLVHAAITCRHPDEVAQLIHERLGSGFSDLLALVEQSNGEPPPRSPRSTGRTELKPRRKS
jgi:phosphotransferase system enzyme I (PtsI)